MLLFVVMLHRSYDVRSKRVTSLLAYLRVIAPGQHSSFQGNVEAVGSRWQQLCYHSEYNERFDFKPRVIKKRSFLQKLAVEKIRIEAYLVLCNLNNFCSSQLPFREIEYFVQW